MKKMSVLMFSIVSFFTLTGCNRVAGELNATQAAELFTEQLIHENARGRFDEQFVDGEHLAQSMAQVGEHVSESFFDDFVLEGAVIDESTRDELVALMKARLPQTHFRVLPRVDTDFPDYETVEYQIFGLDYMSLMQAVGGDLVQAMDENREIIHLPQEMMNITIESLRTHIPQMIASTTGVYTELRFFQEYDGRWHIAPHQEEAIRTMFLSFLTGTADEQSLNERVEEALGRVYQTIQE